MKVVIVGGGVAGLSAGWALARRGEAVLVLEAGEIGRGASWAAAGYLEPAATPAEGPEADAVAALEWDSLRAWPGWAEALEREAGEGIDFRLGGQLRVAYGAEAAALREEAARRRALGWRVEETDGAGARALEPGLSGEVAAGMLLPEVGWADGRRVCRALAAAIRARGGRVEERRPVRALVREGGAVRGVETEAGRETGDAVVLAAGWRFGEVGGLPAPAPEGFGMKGVILTLGPGPGTPAVSRLVKGPEGFVLPRGDGRLLVGVTRELDWETEGPEAGAVARLLAAAMRMVPGVAALPFLEAVVGFRPFLGDLAPRVETAAGGLVLSLGHGADGYLRAPALSERVADLVQRRNAGS